MKKTPVAVIGFVRADVLEMTLRRLSKCEDVLDRDIFVYLSAPRSPAEKIKTDAVHELVVRYRESSLPNIVIVRRDKNEGAGKNIRHAVTETLKQPGGRAIVIEDDILVSNTFLKYMDAALEYYENDRRIWCVNGHRQPYREFPSAYPHDVYLNPRNMAWGWGTWKDRWDAVDFSLGDYEAFSSSDENMAKLLHAGADVPAMLEKACRMGLDTWDVQCSYHMVKNGLYGVECVKSLTKNIGFCRIGSVNCTRPNGMLSKQKFYDFMPEFASVDDMLSAEAPYWEYFRFNVSERRLFRYCLRMASRYFKYYFGKDNNEPIGAQA